ncbi:MAG: hypothetical protein E7573_07270 [Ruminococcaceae bacterium]|nr:hypothetical protein [Oscillospiraceae bacterium]MBR3598132.1 hypothetical protein [Clostridia bacterium]
MDILCAGGHTDEIFDGYCDRCGADLVLDDMLYPSVPSGPVGIIDMIKRFFESIIAFIKKLFS